MYTMKMRGEKGPQNGYSVWSPFCFSKNSMNEKSLGENTER